MINNRGDFPINAVLGILLIYVMYLYNGASSKLSDSEQSVEMHRREADVKADEVHDLILAEESCQRQKRETSNKLDSAKQQYALLQIQHKETEADYIKLKNDVETLKLERAQAERQHATEYQQLQQQKEMESQDLRDDISDCRQHNEELAKYVAAFQKQV